MLASRHYRSILNALEKVEALVEKPNKLSEEDMKLLEGILKLGEVVEELEKRARLAELTSLDADYAPKKLRSSKQKSRKR